MEQGSSPDLDVGGGDWKLAEGWVGALWARQGRALVQGSGRADWPWVSPGTPVCAWRA